MTKLEELAEEEGFRTVDDLLSAYVIDSIAPGICINPSCGYCTEVEPDCRGGWCGECETQSVQSAFVLADVI
ncbi:MAG: hypothetical protein GY835_04895 [bacterium]|nr:hypothetical protein [bacterium]